MSQVGQFVWYDHWSNDLKAAEDFYTHVVGWKTQPFGEDANGYVMWTAGDTPIGGLGKAPANPDGSPGQPQWVAFVAVQDADTGAARARELGGAVRTPGTDIPGVGRFAVIEDPQGALIALFSSDREAPETPDRTRPGMVPWHELHTTDHQAAWRFYAELFGWKHTSTLDAGEDGPYFMFRQADAPEDRPCGGMSDLAARFRVSPHWLYYISVADLEGALDRTRQRGGRVANGPMDVPGGRVAQCSDPQGGRFALFSLKQG